MTEFTPKRDRKYSVPDRNICKRYEMFCGRVSQVNKNSVSVTVPKKEFPVLVSLEDFVEQIEVEEGDMVGIHYWILPGGESGRYAEIMKPNNEQSYFLRKIKQEKKNALKGYSGVFPPKDNNSSSCQTGLIKNKTEWKDIFDLAKERYEKKK